MLCSDNFHMSECIYEPIYKLPRGSATTEASVYNRWIRFWHSIFGEISFVVSISCADELVQLVAEAKFKRIGEAYRTLRGLL